MLRHLAAALFVIAPAVSQSLPPVPAPAENPVTAPKALLGKVLFWDEQLSADDTMACGTCHIPAAGGADPAPAVHPGRDLRFFTGDDGLGSRGVVHRDAAGAYAAEPTFGFARQVTRRIAPSAFGSQWAREQFWDGRAADRFVDPQTGLVSIPQGGSLESQSLGPIFSAQEMANAGRTWAEVLAKLSAARPLALATNLPADVRRALQSAPTYPDLFRAAFGDAALTAERIAFALATYERTLVPDQTPWDRFVAGDPTALTAQQQRGLQTFRSAQCAQCHSPPQFTDDTFRNVGVRPVAEDEGRKEVTGKLSDRGRFKTPSLRSVALKPAFMHNGRFVTLRQVVDFYAGRLPSFPDNQDPLYQSIALPGSATAPLLDFLTNALTDPRMARELPPFDRPTLRSERAPNLVYGAGAAGSGGLTPRLIGHQPAHVGAFDFRIGLHDGRGGAATLLVLSAARRSYPGFPAPVHVDLDQAIGFHGTLAPAGHGTWQLPLPSSPALRGHLLRAQAFVADPAGPAGVSASEAIEFGVL